MTIFLPARRAATWRVKGAAASKPRASAGIFVPAKFIRFILSKTSFLREWEEFNESDEFNTDPPADCPRSGSWAKSVRLSAMGLRGETRRRSAQTLFSA